MKRAASKSSLFSQLFRMLTKNLAGAGGFEPPYGGIKIRCLTTWLRPNRQQNTVARAIPEGICLTGAVCIQLKDKK
jgi:hypothetical protein